MRNIIIKYLNCLVIIVLLCLFTSCSSGGQKGGENGYDNSPAISNPNVSPVLDQYFYGVDSSRSFINGSLYVDESISSNDRFSEIKETGYLKVSDNPISTLSLNSSTSSYTNFRQKINSGYLPTKDSVRIEDMLNYFSYDYDSPDGEHPLTINSEVSVCPWDTNHHLITLGIKAKEIDIKQTQGNNLVFLIDVSGSMVSRLELMKQSFKLLLECLGDEDVVSLVTYANNAKTVFTGIKAKEKVTIMNYIDSLYASGGTNFSTAMGDAYNIATQYAISGGNNRVIMATDGDFNIGISEGEDITKFIKAKARSNILLSVFGFGMGNRKDDNLENLANNGNGTAAYIDDLEEAKRVFIEEIGATMVTVAKDVKAQITFDERFVEAYRVLGYENKTLSTSDYTDDTVDAGEITSGHVTTIMYEVVLKETMPTIDEYFASVGIRYKNPNDSNEQAISLEITSDVNLNNFYSEPSDNVKFASSLVEVALLLRNSDFKGDASYGRVISRLEGINTLEKDSYKTEFLNLVKKINSGLQ